MSDLGDSASLRRIVSEQSAELAALHHTLANLHAASKELLALPSHIHDKAELAQRGVDVLVHLIQAHYGAVGLFDDAGKVEHFLYTGITDQQRKLISRLPEGKGLLAAVINENQVICLEVLSEDERSIGFPPNHPEMTSLLAAPISLSGHVYGRIYLSDKTDGKLFNESDKQLLTSFANTLALVLHNAEAIAQQRQTEDLAAKILENTLESVIVTDTKMVIESVNPAYCRISGYSPEALIGKRLQQLQYQNEHSRETEEQVIAALHNEGHWQGELWSVRKNGEPYPYAATITAIQAKRTQDTRYVIICRDITKQKKHEEKLHHLAHYDSLTALPNRLLFEDRLGQKINYAHRHKHSIALMFLDLDLFKLVNDSIGHEAGDILLQSVAKRLQQCVRASDTVARLGGDEFTIILDQAGVAEADAVAKKIQLAMSQPFKLNEHEVHMTTSIGIAHYPQDGEDIAALVKNADAAMYHAKDIGNTHCFYTGAMAVDASEQLFIEEQLYTALDNDEFWLAFQSKLALDTEQIIGAKVRLRWNHPILGRVKPSSFIPLAEHTGLIIPIGEWVMRTACQHCKSWQKEDTSNDILITVTLSPRQFASEDLVSMVRSALTHTDLAAHCLELEISERAITTESNKGAKKLADLKALGVGIIVTDLGADEICFNVSEPCSADTLRINSSFTSADKRANGGLTESLISKAHNLKLRVVAEGVETQAQLDFLRSKQCDEVLGYYFSRPVSNAEFEQLLKANRH